MQAWSSHADFNTYIKKCIFQNLQAYVKCKYNTLMACTEDILQSPFRHLYYVLLITLTLRMVNCLWSVIVLQDEHTMRVLGVFVSSNIIKWQLNGFKTKVIKFKLRDPYSLCHINLTHKKWMDAMEFEVQKVFFILHTNNITAFYTRIVK